MKDWMDVATTELRPLGDQPWIPLPHATIGDALPVLDALDDNAPIAEVFEDGQSSGYLVVAGLRDLVLWGRCTAATALEILQAAGAIRLVPRASLAGGEA